MIAFIITWWKFAVALVAVASLSFILGQCSGKKSERNVWETKVAKMAVKAEQLQRKADDLANKAKAKDEAQISTDREEVDNAVRNIPDNATTARQRARACLELRRQARAAGTAEPAC